MEETTKIQVRRQVYICSECGQSGKGALTSLFRGADGTYTTRELPAGWKYRTLYISTIAEDWGSVICGDCHTAGKRGHYTRLRHAGGDHEASDNTEHAGRGLR